MSKVAARPREDGLPEREAPEPNEVRSHLREVLSSPAFQGSKRCQQFLIYVCERSLARQTASLKERTIAVEVFGRNPESDLADDTIVRVGAREVRKRLQQYYLSSTGAASPIRIELPTGSYAPEFRPWRGPAPEPPVDRPASGAGGEVDGKPEGLWRRFWRAGVVVGVVIAACVLIAGRWERPNAEDPDFGRFWDPVFRSSEPLLVAMPHPIVYHPSARAWRLSETNLPKQEIRVPRPIQVPPGDLDGSDMLPVLNQYVGFGDMVAANEVTAMLGQRSHRVRLRMANGIEFPDLRKANALLIGAISNRWTMQLQQNWRYQFRWTPAVRTVVMDTMAGSAERQWYVESKADEAYQEDYVLVCRLRNSVTGGLLLVGAGLKTCGTEAAGRLLTDADQLGSLLRKLPAGWDTKNVQIVLHVKVIGNTPAQPEVVAWQVW